MKHRFSDQGIAINFRARFVCPGKKIFYVRELQKTIVKCEKTYFMFLISFACFSHNNNPVKIYVHHFKLISFSAYVKKKFAQKNAIARINCIWCIQQFYKFPITSLQQITAVQVLQQFARCTVNIRCRVPSVISCRGYSAKNIITF